MAQARGMFTDIQESAIGTRLVTRYRRIWWNVYTFDRRLGSSFGVPTGLDDEDTTAPYPSAMKISSTTISETICPNPASSWGNRSMVSQLYNYHHLADLAHNNIVVYSTDGTINKAFLTAQEVLRGIAGLADELGQYSDRCVGEISLTCVDEETC